MRYFMESQAGDQFFLDAANEQSAKEQLAGYLNRTIDQIVVEIDLIVPLRDACMEHFVRGTADFTGNQPADYTLGRYSLLSKRMDRIRASRVQPYQRGFVRDISPSAD